MIPVSTSNFAASSSGLSALGVGWQSLIIQLITFILAYLVLRKWAFGPIVKILNQRRKAIEDGVKLGEKMRAEEAELEAKIEKSLHETRAKADRIIADAKVSARQLVHEAESDAKDKGEAVLKEARARTELEITSARRKLEREMVGLVADAASALLDEKVDAKRDEGLIERALAGSRRQA